MEKKTVIAAKGLKVPMENASSRYITDADPVEVELTQYYVRRMADGDLLDAKEAAPDKFMAYARAHVDDKEGV